MIIIEVGEKGESPAVSIVPNLLFESGEEVLVLEWENVVLRINHLSLSGMDLLGAIIRAQVAARSKRNK